MKVMQVSAHYPPDFVSGGTLIPRRFAQAVAKRGHESAVFAGRLEGLEPLATMRSIEEGIPVQWVGVSSFLAWDDEKNYRNEGVASVFREYIKEFQPDIVHFHSIHTLGGQLLPLAKEAGAATVLTMHDFWWFCARQFLVTRELAPCPLVVDCGECECARTHEWLGKRNTWLAQQLEYADIVLAPSASAARVFQANGVPEAKIRIHENGVEAPEGVARRTRGSEPVRFMYAGGEAELKGYAVLREAARAAKVPEGTRLDVYNASATGFPAWVHSNPAYTRGELSSVLANHDVLILPSVMRESHSILTREALAAGLSVIATDTLGPEEAVQDGINGRIVAAGSASELARAIEELANPPRCGELMGHGSASPIISASAQEESLCAFYDELAARRGAPAAHTDAATQAESGTAASIERVCIVTGIDGAPCRYRAHLAAEALGTQGIGAEVLHYRNPRLPDACMQADAVVFYRVPATLQIRELMAQLRSTSIPIVGDVDDLIFDPDIEPLLDNLNGLSVEERDLWRRGIYRYRTTFEYCDFFLGSTPTISSQAHRLLGIPTCTWENGVGMKLGQASERALAYEREEGPIRIGYFSGTDTHDADWASIEPAIARVLEQRPGVELWLGGLVEPTEVLSAYAERIRRIPFVAWHELPVHLRHVDVCLAPLTGDSIFNEAKSAIKWLEAALVLTPTVATPTQPFSAAITHSVTGMLASTEEEWVQAIEALLDDDALRASIPRQAKREALMELSPARQGERYARALAQARTYVAEHGHRELSDWVDVCDDEPYSAAHSRLEAYELPSHTWQAAVAAVRGRVRQVFASVREDGVATTGAKVVRKLHFYSAHARTRMQR